MIQAIALARVAAPVLAAVLGACAARPHAASHDETKITPGWEQPTGTMPGGSVRFTGFASEALRDFLVVPETGRTLLPARNGLITGVDGFWWRHERERWFKIPNHCACVVQPDPEGAFPSSFRFDSECDALGSTLQRMRGRPDAPGFQPDTGLTGHPTNYPFHQGVEFP